MKILSPKIIFLICILVLSRLAFADTSEDNSSKTDYEIEYVNSLYTPISNSIENINIQILFPENYKLLDEIKSSAQVYDEEKKYFQEFNIDSTNSVLEINRKFEEKTLILKLKLLYCREDDQPLCIQKQEIYPLFLDENNENHDATIVHRVAEVLE